MNYNEVFDLFADKVILAVFWEKLLRYFVEDGAYCLFHPSLSFSTNYAHFKFLLSVQCILGAWFVKRFRFYKKYSTTISHLM